MLPHSTLDVDRESGSFWIFAPQPIRWHVWMVAISDDRHAIVSGAEDHIHLGPGDSGRHKHSIISRQRASPCPSWHFLPAICDFTPSKVACHSVNMASPGGHRKPGAPRRNRLLHFKLTHYQRPSGRVSKDALWLCLLEPRAGRDQEARHNRRGSRPLFCRAASL